MIVLQAAYLMWFAATWVPSKSNGWLFVARIWVTLVALALWPNYETGLTTIGHLCFLIDFASTFGAIVYKDELLEEAK